MIHHFDIDEQTSKKSSKTYNEMKAERLNGK